MWLFMSISKSLVTKVPVTLTTPIVDGLMGVGLMTGACAVSSFSCLFLLSIRSKRLLLISFAVTNFGSSFCVLEDAVGRLITVESLVRVSGEERGDSESFFVEVCWL